ncbi:MULTISPECIES: hypothetical protein [Mycolicibacter]|uniref:Uncharacterized protein n=1 Tax=Mycolicibacter longobardus TaxID=1108812 RepID=A0A1X1YAL9_9MYCO|nr:MULTISPECIES: hypothetical protein [Mycolicibacter]ORW08071.1 hypothetical protein AWC16_20265 [Mycolicibacter longobardus]RAV04283.1 hypothetical protein DQP56_00245 [Mycolicibacter senuensis]
MSSIQQLDPQQIDAMRREINHGLMVTFINAELLERASLDVGRSVVFYDADHGFLYAVAELPDTGMLQRLYDNTSIRFWSYGC